MDDDMFQKICEELDTCQEIISTILGEHITVVEVVPQDSIMNLQGRSVRLDCLCRLDDGTYVNVEVQKSDNDDHQMRVRYHAALIAANKTPKSTHFKDVAKIIVIYITRFDIFEGGLPIYHVSRMIDELGVRADNGFSEIYVNTVAKNHDNELNSNVSDLMALFTDRETLNPEKFPKFSNRKNQFINTEKGVFEMCEKVEKAFEQVIRQREMNNLFGYVQKGGMSVPFAAREVNMTPTEFRNQMILNGYTVPVRGRRTAQKEN